MTCLLILLPGLDGTELLFGPLIKELEDDYLVIPYPPEMPTAYSDLLPIVLQALPRERDFVLLGWSFSGPLALRAAATHPPGLRGVILCASFVQNPHAWIPASVRHFARAWMFYFSAWLAQVKTRLPGNATDSFLNLLARAHSLVPSRVMAARVREVL